MQGTTRFVALSPRRVWRTQKTIWVRTKPTMRPMARESDQASGERQVSRRRAARTVDAAVLEHEQDHDDRAEHLCMSGAAQRGRRTRAVPAQSTRTSRCLTVMSETRWTGLKKKTMIVATLPGVRSCEAARDKPERRARRCQQAVSASLRRTGKFR